MDAAPAATFDSLDPSTGAVVGTFPVDDAGSVGRAVERARAAAAWWRRPRVRRARPPSQALQVRDRQADRRVGRSGPPRERQAPRRRGARDHPGRRPSGLGDRPRQEGARTASGVGRPSRRQQHRLGRVPAARRGRRDRPMELPGVHADGFDRLRPGRRQRRGVQAERVHPGHRPVAGGRLGPGRPRGAGRAHSRDRLRRHRGRPVPVRGRQDRLHRLGGHRSQGDGRLRRGPGAGADGVRRQGRPAGGCRRRPRRRGGRRPLVRDVERRPDVHRHRAGVRGRRRL